LYTILAPISKLKYIGNKNNRKRERQTFNISKDLILELFNKLDIYLALYIILVEQEMRI